MSWSKSIGNQEYDARVKETSQRVMQNEREGLYEGRVEGTREYPPHYKAQFTGHEAKIYHGVNEILSDIVVEFMTEKDIQRIENPIDNLKGYAQYCKAYNKMFEGLFKQLHVVYPGFLDMMKQDLGEMEFDKFFPLLQSFLRRFSDKHKEQLWQA